MKKFIMLYIVLSVLFANIDSENKYLTDYIDQQSSFYYKQNFYKLVTKGTLIHNDDYYDNSLSIHYDVYKNGVKMKSENIKNIIKADCDYINGGPFENHYEIELIKDIEAYGWIIYSGGICGNTFSYNAEIILPHLDERKSFISLNKIFKSKPIIIKQRGYLDIFYDFQEWNCSGTACSIYVPQKLRYNLSNSTTIKLPIEINDFKYIGEYGFRSVFMAGFYDLNPRLMQYALDELYDSEDSCIDGFFCASFKDRKEEINLKSKYIKINSTSRYRFQKIIDELWDITKIIKAI